jgi:hypothetical protein
MMGVLAAGKSKISHCIQLEKIRAGHLEKVGQQLVGGPLDYEGGEVIEYVEHLSPSLLNDVMYLAAEGIESLAGINVNDLETSSGFDNRLVRGESHVYASPPIPNRLIDERPDKSYIILQALDLPDDVIPQPKPFYDLVQ